MMHMRRELKVHKGKREVRNVVGSSGSQPQLNLNPMSPPDSPALKLPSHLSSARTFVTKDIEPGRIGTSFHNACFVLLALVTLWRWLCLVRVTSPRVPSFDTSLACELHLLLRPEIFSAACFFPSSATTTNYTLPTVRTKFYSQPFVHYIASTNQQALIY